MTREPDLSLPTFVFQVMSRLARETGAVDPGKASRTIPVRATRRRCFELMYDADLPLV